MSEEEKKAIGILRALNDTEKKCKIDQTFYSSQIKRIMITLLPEDFGVFDILLNLIKKQQKEIDKFKESADYNWEQYQDIGNKYFNLIEKIQEEIDRYYDLDYVTANETVENIEKIIKGE